ncbi:Uncharacterised protein [Corynebacterium minutissimum]|uniref:Uncharacterized protein n=1 Tax=Corynebacterium minutissimum TaxID=38301 RepID=A0A376CRQ3_9CORY|nr:Uncharacterised protein [Corynebacterium minutissimum]
MRPLPLERGSSSSATLRRNLLTLFCVGLSNFRKAFAPRGVKLIFHATFSL